MNLRKRRRRRFLAIVLLLAVIGLVLLIEYRFAPIVEALSITTVTNRTSNVINDAINEQISEHEIQYDSIVSLEKDMDGRITALKTDMSEVNRLKTEILDIISDRVLDLTVEELGIPVGSVLFPTAFSGRGFIIPVKLMSVESSGAEFNNQFSEAGINQTLHEIVLKVMIDVAVLTPNGVEYVQSSSEVVVAQTVIVGDVPQTVITMNGDT